MNDRAVAVMLQFGAADGTLTGNVSAVVEFKYPWVFSCVKACASNDSSATLAATGGVTITATAIGDSGDPTEIEGDDSVPVNIDADESTTFSLDYDGASGTAAQNVSALVMGWLGEGAP